MFTFLFSSEFKSTLSFVKLFYIHILTMKISKYICLETTPMFNINFITVYKKYFK